VTGVSVPSPAPVPAIIVLTKITEQLTANAEGHGTHVPWGSVLFHWANGVTELDGPDGSLLWLSRDAEAAQLPHPSGPGAPL
jgi:hypothetical protein